MLSLISTAPGQFATCPVRNSDTVCSDPQPKEISVNESVVLDTAAIFHLNKSGPCQLNQTAFFSRLYLEDTDTVYYDCLYDHPSLSTLPAPCESQGRVTLKFNTDENGGSNAFNFQMEIQNVQLSDSGRYRYEAQFNVMGFPGITSITKYFDLVVTEFMGEWNCTLMWYIALRVIEDDSVSLSCKKIDVFLCILFLFIKYLRYLLCPKAHVVLLLHSTRYPNTNMIK